MYCFCAEVINIGQSRQNAQEWHRTLVKRCKSPRREARPYGRATSADLTQHQQTTQHGWPHDPLLCSSVAFRDGHLVACLWSLKNHFVFFLFLLSVFAREGTPAKNTRRHIHFKVPDQQTMRWPAQGCFFLETRGMYGAKKLLFWIKIATLAPALSGPFKVPGQRVLSLKTFGIAFPSSWNVFMSLCLTIPKSYGCFISATSLLDLQLQHHYM